MTGWFAYVGCRTSRERNAIGDGISLFHVDETGDWQAVDVLRGLENPSWLTMDATGSTLYVAHGDRQEVSAFRIDPADGRLTPLGSIHCEGRNPVHIAVAPSGTFLIITNHVVTPEYRSGLVSIALGADGSLGQVIGRLPFDGQVGPHRVEQLSPKPHQAVFDPSGRWLVVPDKGTNELVVTCIDANGRFGGKATPVTMTRETAGPRHIAFHPLGELAFVVNELDSTIVACRFDAATGALWPIQYIPSVRPTCVVDSRGGEVAVSVDGSTVYVSNRGDDTVGAFHVAGDGTLSPLGWASTGRTPRFFALHPDGASLLVASEEDHEVSSKSIATDGSVNPSRLLARVGSPTCIVLRARG